MTALLMAAAPFILNSAMGLVKWLGAQDMTKPGKRFVLAVLALVGVIAANALGSASPLQLDSISFLVQIALESLAAFLAAHGSYVLFWKK